VRGRASEKESKWPKVPTSTHGGAIYREEEVVVCVYSIGGVKYYKKVPRIYKQVSRIYKQVPECCK